MCLGYVRMQLLAFAVSLGKGCTNLPDNNGMGRVTGHHYLENNWSSVKSCKLIVCFMTANERVLDGINVDIYRVWSGA